ncbi:hypothetical protein GO613_02370 [Azoarcus communis]|nr:hypothetical protein [Parazoarcus communis]NMG46948.1 hypothetical protein [Parazoarcus communis]
MASTQEYIDAAQDYLDQLETCLNDGDIDSAIELLPALEFAIDAIGEADD